MRKTVFLVIAILMTATLLMAAEQTSRTRLADGFDMPVGKPDGEGYYMQRGFRPNGHLGEDWNGMKGGNSDLGAPVYATAHGMVVFAKDVRLGWGNVVIIRHAYLENGKINMVDSLYGHLHRIMVREGQQIVRGQQIGTIGSNRGMYVAHLHFEMRKNIYVGISRSQFKRDFSTYYSPIKFISAHRKLDGGGRSATIAINTFDTNRKFNEPADESKESAPVPEKPGSGSKKNKPAPARRPFEINRFGDMNTF